MNRPPLRRPKPDTPVFGRAIVLGGSIAGLLTARVLADHFAEVVVVDRDDLDADLTAPRRGVSQGRHTHGLLVGGLRAIERLLPEITDQLTAGGGQCGNLLQRVAWHIGGGRLMPAKSGLVGIVGSRTLVESRIRQRVRAVPRVRTLCRHDIAGLKTTPDRARVVGARVTDRASGASREMDADLVVDATGRGSRAPVWLADLGYPPPEEELVRIDLRYVTRVFRRSNELGDLDAVVLAATPPQQRSGFVVATEPDRWMVTLAGCLGEQPPTDLEGFEDFARMLDSPAIADLIHRAEPLGEAETIRFPANRWLHYEKCGRLPDGFVAIGDAVGSFNPVFGQGMTSAALQAEALGQVIARRAFQARTGADAAATLAGVPHEAAPCLAAVVAAPWALAVGTDLRHPGMPAKPLPQRILDRYLDRLLVVARTDGRVAVAFAAVLNLVAPPQSLLHPMIAARVLRLQRSRPVPPVALVTEPTADRPTF
jgi:2-polyprenyl-6-methoxyphenol hydroxylase-like FAD-dependent oxidoreductase